MNFAVIFDIAACIVLGILALRGAMRGLSGELLSILGLAVSVFCAWTFAAPAAAFIRGYFPGWDFVVTKFVMTAVLFLAASLLFAAVNSMLRALLHLANLSLLDHVLGFFAGAFKTGALLLLLYGALTLFSPALPTAWMQDSYAMRGAAVVWPPVMSFLQSRDWLKSDVLAPFPASEEGRALPDNVVPEAKGEGKERPL